MVKESIRLYFKEGDERGVYLISNNRLEWLPLLLIEETDENIKLVEPTPLAGLVFYTYFKQIKKMVIQKNYAYPLLGSFAYTFILNRCR